MDYTTKQPNNLLRKYQWYVIHNPRLSLFGGDEEETSSITSIDLQAKYVINVYSPWLSFLIEEAFEIKDPPKRAIRIRELVYQMTQSSLFEQEYNDIEKILDNSNYPYFKIKKDKNNAGGYWVNSITPMATGTIFYLVHGNGYRDANGKIKIPYDKFTIKRLEYGTSERGTKDYYIKDMEHVEVSDPNYSFIERLKNTSGHLLPPVLYTHLTDNASAFTVGYNYGVGYFWGGYYSGSMGFAFDKYNNYAIMTSQAGFLSGITAIAGDSDPESFNNIFLGANWSFGVGYEFTNFDHVKEFSGFIQNIKLDVPIQPIDIGFSYGVDYNDFKSFSIGASVGDFGRISNEIEETKVLAFTDKDILYVKKALDKIQDRSDEFQSKKKDFRFLFRNIENNEPLDYYMWIIYKDYPKNYFINENSILNGDIHFEKYQIENYHILSLTKEDDYYFKTSNVVDK